MRAALLILLLVPDHAAADCRCRARGVVAVEGEVACIAAPQGRVLARCGKVLNNASWVFLNKPCPEAVSVLAPRKSGRPAAALR